MGAAPISTPESSGQQGQMGGGMGGGMEGSPSYGTFSSGMQGYTSPQMQQQQAMPQQRMMPPQYQPQQRAPQYQQQMPSYQGGLQAALMNMMQQYSRPAMRAPVQQGLAPYSYAMNYRPNSLPNQQNLGRTAMTTQAAQAAAAEKAKPQQNTPEQDDFLNWQRRQYEASKNPSGSEGG